MKKLITVTVSILLFTVNTFSQNFWQQTGGPVGGNIVSIALLPSNNATMYAVANYTLSRAGNTGSTIYQSTNSGNTWSILFATDNYTINHLTVNPVSGIIYASTTNAGVLVSPGFTQMNTGLTNLNVRGMVINATGDSIYVCAGNAGVFVNVAGTWTQMNAGLNSLTTRALAISSTGRIALAVDSATLGSGGIYLYDRNAHTWVASTGTGTQGMNAVGFSANGNSIFCASRVNAAAPTTPHIYVNPGTGWTLTPAIPYMDNITAMAGNANNELLVGSNKYGLYKLTNTGWVSLNTTLTTFRIRTIIMNSSNKLYIGTNGGVFRADSPGLTWAARNVNILAYTNEALAFNTGGEMLVGAIQNGLYHSGNGGTTYNQVMLNDTDVYSLSTAPTGAMFMGTFVTNTAGTGIGQIYKSINNGVNWASSSTGLSAVSYTASFEYNSVGDIFAGTGLSLRPLYTSSAASGGNIWTVPENADFPVVANFNPVTTTTNVLSMKYHASTGNLFVGTQNMGVLRSSDNGVNFTQVLPDSGQYILDMAFTSTGNLFIISNTSGVMMSPDDGNTWQTTGITIGGFSLMVTTGDTIYAGTMNGVMISSDNGATWTGRNAGLNTFHAEVMKVNPVDNYIYAGTAGGSVFKSAYPIPTVTSVKNNNNVNLFFIYPNPNNGTFTIHFNGLENQTNRIEIYNTIGQTVFSQDFITTGNTLQNINLPAIPTGIYSVKVIAGNTINTQKLSIRN